MQTLNKFGISNANFSENQQKSMFLGRSPYGKSTHNWPSSCLQVQIVFWDISDPAKVQPFFFLSSPDLHPIWLAACVAIYLCAHRSASQRDKTLRPNQIHNFFPPPFLSQSSKTISHLSSLRNNRIDSPWFGCKQLRGKLQNSVDNSKIEWIFTWSTLAASSLSSEHWKRVSLELTVEKCLTMKIGEEKISTKNSKNSSTFFYFSTERTFSQLENFSSLFSEARFIKSCKTFFGGVWKDFSEYEKLCFFENNINTAYARSRSFSFS